MNLTFNPSTANLNESLPHEAVGFCTPELKGQNRPLLTVVFLCPSKTTSKGSLLTRIFMVDCIRQLSSWPAPLSGSANPMQSASNDFALMKGGLQSYEGETAMRNLTKKTIQFVSDKKLTTPSNLTLQQAKKLVAKAHNLAFSISLLKKDLSLLIEAAEVIADAVPGEKEKAYLISKKFKKADGLLAGAAAMANSLYHIGFDALKETDNENG